MKKKIDRQRKLINQYTKDVKELMDRHDFRGFITGLRLAKVAFIMSYQGRNKKFMKDFHNLSGDETIQFVDKQIAPFFTWKKAQ